MLLRDHPELSNKWPPSWGGSYGRGDKLASGINPEKLLSVKESANDQSITLTAEYEGRECIGVITIEDPKVRHNFVEVFRDNIGKSIKEIDSIDLQF